LCPSDHLTEVVGSGCKAVISARKIGESPHLTQALFPNEAKIDKADIVRRTVESEATPPLPQRLRRESLGNTHDDPRSILHVPCYTAVCSAERDELEKRTVSPQRSVLGSIRQSGISRRPAVVTGDV